MNLVDGMACQSPPRAYRYNRKMPLFYLLFCGTCEALNAERYLSGLPTGLFMTQNSRLVLLCATSLWPFGSGDKVELLLPGGELAEYRIYKKTIHPFCSTHSNILHIARTRLRTMGDFSAAAPRLWNVLHDTLKPLTVLKKF